MALFGSTPPGVDPDELDPQKRKYMVIGPRPVAPPEIQASMNLADPAGAGNALPSKPINLAPSLPKSYNDPAHLLTAGRSGITPLPNITRDPEGMLQSDPQAEMYSRLERESPPPVSPYEQNLAHPMGIDSNAIKARPATPTAPLDPATRAKQEIGPQKKRGFFGVLKDIGIGLAAGGARGALEGGILGGDYRYQNRVNERAGELAMQDALQRQQQEDALRAENIRTDNERQAKEADWRHQYEMAKLQPRTPVGGYQKGSEHTIQGIGPDGRTVYYQMNPQTGRYEPTNIGVPEKPEKPGGVQQDPEEWTRRASELRRSMPTDEQGNPIDPKTGRPLSPYEIDTMIREQLHKEGIKPANQLPSGTGPRPQYAAPQSAAEQVYGVGAPGTANAPAPIQPRPQQPVMTGHQPPTGNKSAKFNGGKGGGKDLSSFEQQVQEIERTAPNSPEAQQARAALEKLKQRYGNK